MSKENFKLKDKLKQAFGYLIEHPILLIVILSYSITFINEALNRHSIWEAVVFLFTQPFMFLTNMSIIALCESLALFAKKRSYWLVFMLLFVRIHISKLVRSVRKNASIFV